VLRVVASGALLDPRRSIGGDMSRIDPRRLLARAALLGCVLMATIVASSAFLRLSAAGLGCDGWPECYGQIRRVVAEVPGLQPVEPVAGAAFARTAHRISAMLAGIVVAFTLGLSALQGARSLHNLAVGSALVALTVFLAVLGRSTAGTLSTAVTLANLAGGYAMLVLFWSLYVGNRAEAQPGVPPPRWLPALAVAVLLLASAQALVGGLVSARFGATSCADLASCWPVANAPGVFARALDPFGALTLDASGRVVPGADAAAVHALHRAGAFAVMAGVLVLSIALAVRARRPLVGGLLAGIVLVQATAGWSLASLQFPLVIALTHNALGALLLMTIVAALHGSSSRGRRAPGAT